VLTIQHNYAYGANYPILFNDPKTGQRLTHINLGAATITERAGLYWFVVRFDNPTIHKETVNIEGSTFNGNPPIFKPLREG